MSGDMRYLVTVLRIVPQLERCADLAEPDDPVERVVDLMRKNAVRRIPVVDGGRLAGVVSIGDLAIERDPDSALADISAAREND